MQGNTYKIIRNKLKVNIQTQVNKGNEQIYGIISISDVSKVYKFEKEKVAGQIKNIYLQ